MREDDQLVARAEPLGVQTLQSQIAAARRARAKVLRSFSNADLIAALGEASVIWCNENSPARLRATDALSKHLNMAAAMIDKGLGYIFGALSPGALEDLLRRECANPAALESGLRSANGGSRRLGGPAVIFYSLAGNVPGLGIPVVAVSLLARSACVIRESSRQPSLTSAFVETLSRCNRDMAAMVVATSWEAGDPGYESTVMSAAERVELFGSDSTLERIAARHRGRSVIAHGSRVSIGLVPIGSDTDRWTRAFAEDVAMYEGRGCLSPHVIIVEGAATRASRMARGLSVELARLHRLWPRGDQGIEMETRRRGFAGRAELSAAQHDDELLLRNRDDAWIVHLDPRARIEAGPGLRCVKVLPVRDRAATLGALREARLPIAAVGLALGDDELAFEEHAHELRDEGVTLVCRPGQMQAPPLSWAQDGGRRLGDLLEWYEESDI